MVAVGGVRPSGGAPARLRWSLVVSAAQSDPRGDRLSGRGLVVCGEFLFPGGGGRGCLARGGEHLGFPRSWGRLVSPTMAAGVETSPESFQHGRRRRERRVPPAENHSLLVWLGAWPIGRGRGGRATGDVSGQPLGLIPLIGGCGACPFGVVEMQAADRGERRRLVRSASSSPARCGIHGGGEYVSINDVG